MYSRTCLLFEVDVVHLRLWGIPSFHPSYPIGPCTDCSWHSIMPRCVHRTKPGNILCDWSSCWGSIWGCTQYEIAFHSGMPCGSWKASIPWTSCPHRKPRSYCVEVSMDTGNFGSRLCFCHFQADNVAESSKQRGPISTQLIAVQVPGILQAKKQSLLTNY